MGGCTVAVHAAIYCTVAQAEAVFIAWHMPHKGLGTQSSVSSTVTIRLLHFLGLSQGSAVTCVDADEVLHNESGLVVDAMLVQALGARFMSSTPAAPLTPAPMVESVCRPMARSQTSLAAVRKESQVPGAK